MLRVLGDSGSRGKSVSCLNTDSSSLTHKPSHANLVTTVNFFSISSAKMDRINELMLKMKSEQPIYRLTLAVISCWYLSRMQTSTLDTKYLGSNATSYSHA